MDVLIDVVDPIARDEVVLAVLGIALGQLDVGTIQVIDGADQATFRVLNAAFECSADAKRAYYRQTVIAGADPQTFPPGRAVTNCTETTISFAQ